MCVHALSKNSFVYFYVIEDGTQGFGLIGKQLHHTALSPAQRFLKQNPNLTFLPGL